MSAVFIERLLMPILDGSSYASFVISLSQAAIEPVAIGWRTESVTAVPGVDYAETSGTVNFLPTETEKTVQVLVYGRAPGDTEPREFRLHLLPSPNVVLGSATRNCIITVRDEADVVVSTVTVATGQTGLNAYEFAKLLGFVGTPAEWVESLKGQGDKGDTGDDGLTASQQFFDAGLITDPSAATMFAKLAETGAQAGLAAVAPAIAQAEASADESEASAQRSEAASVAALVGVIVHNNEEEGRLATEEGDQYRALIDEGEGVGLFRNDGATSALIFKFLAPASLATERADRITADDAQNASLEGVAQGFGDIIALVASAVEDQREAIEPLLSPPPDRSYMRRGVWPLAEQGDDVLLWVDQFGRIGGQEFAAGPDPEPVSIRDGMAVVRRDLSGQVVEWYDYRNERARLTGDLWDRTETSIPGASLSTISGGDVTAAIAADGAFMEPASSDAPVAFIKPVDDGAGPIGQVHIATGTAVYRLTSSPVDCHAPKIIAPGLVKYARDDGIIANARGWLDEAPSTSAIEAYLLHGQSLAGGSTNPIHDLTAPDPPDPDVLMFNGGIRAGFGTDVSDPDNFASFTPAHEEYFSTRGDTGRTCFGFSMKRARHAQILVASTGTGGASFDIIGPGTVIWDNLLYGVMRGKALAEAAGKSFTVRSVHWRHGESNGATGAAGYADMLDQAIVAIQSNITAITDQPLPPIMSLQQINHPTMVGGVYTIFGPGDGQGIVGLNDPRAILCCPQYLGEFIDVYHMTPQSYARMDSYVAKATRRHLFEGRPWNPLHMAAAVRSGRKILVTIAGGMVDYGGAITSDTRRVSDPGNLGFVYRDSTDSAYIVAVEIAGRDQLIIWLNAAPTGSGQELGVAYWAPWATSSPAQGPTTGLRSCIRDNDPECCPMTGYPLHNYLISQKIGVSA